MACHTHAPGKERSQTQHNTACTHNAQGQHCFTTAAAASGIMHHTRAAKRHLAACCALHAAASSASVHEAAAVLGPARAWHAACILLKVKLQQQAHTHTQMQHSQQQQQGKEDSTANSGVLESDWHAAYGSQLHQNAVEAHGIGVQNSAAAQCAPLPPHHDKRNRQLLLLGILYARPTQQQCTLACTR